MKSESETKVDSNGTQNSFPTQNPGLSNRKDEVQATRIRPGTRRYHRFSGVLTHYSVLLLTLFAITVLPNCSPEEVNLQGSTMGTSYSVKIRNPEQHLDTSTLKEEIDQLLHETDYRFSSWQKEELHRINNQPVGQSIPISPDFCVVLYKSQMVWQASQGAFDPTIGTLINLWGFGPEKRTGEPSESEVQKALLQSGFEKLKLNYPSGPVESKYNSDLSHIRTLYDEQYTDESKTGTSTKANPARTSTCQLTRTANLNLNLSAIAKGHGVDRLAEFLLRKGIKDFMVEIGGEVKTGPGGSFRIGIERPNYDGSRSLYTVLESANNCIATSGNYRNFFEKDGHIYSHLLDPNTGRPGLSRIQSATIIGPDCAIADALATAAMIVSPERTQKIIKEVQNRTGQNYDYLLLESGKLIQGDTENFKIQEYTSDRLASIRIDK